MKRIIPILLIKDRLLYKTNNFKNPSYVGDPIVAIKIFNEKEVDELMILDIDKSNKEPDFDFLYELAGEAFMPLSYGGGITNVNYAAFSMLSGDSFGKEFGSAYDANGSLDGTDGEDWLLLKILCYNLSDVLVDSVELYLADYRFADNTQDYIQKNWTTVSLTSAETLGRLKFNLTSSDEGQWGMNTPAFFAIDDLSAGFANIEENELTSRIYPNPAIDIVNVQTNSDNGTIEIFDITGKQISSNNYTSKMFQLNISTFPAGTYYAVISSETSRKTTKIIKQ